MTSGSEFGQQCQTKGKDTFLRCLSLEKLAGDELDEHLSFSKTQFQRLQIPKRTLATLNFTVNFSPDSCISSWYDIRHLNISWFFFVFHFRCPLLFLWWLQQLKAHMGIESSRSIACLQVHV